MNIMERFLKHILTAIINKFNLIDDCYFEFTEINNPKESVIDDIFDNVRNRLYYKIIYQRKNGEWNIVIIDEFIWQSYPKHDEIIDTLIDGFKGIDFYKNLSYFDKIKFELIINKIDRELINFSHLPYMEIVMDYRYKSLHSFRVCSQMFTNKKK